MSAIVFIGPTISEEEVKSVLDAECWPPAAQGDVFRAVQTQPRCLGIIDGYFDGVASVWHKEILWAISQGVEVIGASSMGALRAAELSKFGMTGVGQIFQSFRSGEIEDDDEVAVVHGPAELGFVPLSKTGAELLFELISQRYERGSTLITSNLPLEEWTETFGT